MNGDLASGCRPLLTSPNTEEARRFFRSKNKKLVNKLMPVGEAVRRLVKDGDYMASGGFGTNRIPTAALHEILRQKKKNLGFAGHTSTHDFEILAAGNLDGGKLISRIDVAYVVGLEARGLSAQARRIMESGEIEVCEWTNYALTCRLKAAAVGIPFFPSFTMLGTDTFKYSAAKEIRCPFTGVKLLALPALYPDVAIIHVHEADCFGNSRICGITVSDLELARASKKVIVTAERIISPEEIRDAPDATSIPAVCVDAVCEVRYGSYPGNMPGEYFSDEEHLAEWLQAEKDEAGFREFLRRHIYDVPDFQTYLAGCGGAKRLDYLRELELTGSGNGASHGGI